MWYYIESNWDGRKILVQIPYRSPEEAEQAALRETRMGEYRILAYPTRNKRLVLRTWRQEQYSV
jgi:hypothetical protein